MSGKALIFCAPSGGGKSTFIKYLRSQGVEFEFSVSAASRSPRKGEIDGVHYHFMSEEAFRQLIAEDAFVEYEEVFEGHLYGTLKQQVEDALAAGRNLVFDVDVNGGLRLKHYFGDRALSLFIQPPSLEVLRQRLVNRGTETPEKIEKRLARAQYEISRAPEFDCTIVNDDLATAQAKMLAIVANFLGR